jgi:hypothetical protein
MSHRYSPSHGSLRMCYSFFYTSKFFFRLCVTSDKLKVIYAFISNHSFEFWVRIKMN